MDNEYIVDDLNRNVFEGASNKITAKSPLEAVKKAGYENIKRVKSGGNIVVRGAWGTYVYKGVFEKSD